MPLNIEPYASQHSEPDVAQRRVLRQNEVLAQFKVRPASSQDGRTIIKIMDTAYIRTKSQGHVIEQAGAVDFLGRFEPASNSACTLSRALEASRRSPGE